MGREQNLASSFFVGAAFAEDDTRPPPRSPRAIVHGKIEHVFLANQN